MNHQYLLSLRALHHVRSVEALLGVASLAHLSRHPAANRPTPAKRHAIPDRAARKAKAREFAMARMVGV